ncbi:MAG: hypothetical protein WCY93_12265 [Anaerolineaceae bacterium]
MKVLDRLTYEIWIADNQAFKARSLFKEYGSESAAQCEQYYSGESHGLRVAQKMIKQELARLKNKNKFQNSYL